MRGGGGKEREIKDQEMCIVKRTFTMTVINGVVNTFGHKKHTSMALSG